MSELRWSELEDLYHRLHELPAPEREAQLAGLRRDQPDLAREVEVLLAAPDDDDSFLAPVLDRTRGGSRAAGSLPPGTLLGAYRVEEEIGRGGMGVVHRARRADGQFEQTVAIKVLLQRSSSDDLRARFRREQRTMAQLDHPHIARLFDGGVTADGVEYFVMEFVEGIPIDEYCDRDTLTIDERLRLFEKVCRAVHAAHRHFVVHRDLKPSNILVDRDGHPKLLDFGIAKNLRQDEADLRATRTGQRMMTPRYASPEQVRGGAITAATDVYALGVILHELLCGVSPYRLETSDLHALERAICDLPPTSPSRSVGGSDAAAVDRARSRATDPLRLRRRLRGDLDAVVRFALAKDAEDRYPSALALAEDVTAVLHRHPVRVPSPSLVQRGWSVVRERLGWWIGLGLAAAFLLAGTAAWSHWRGEVTRLEEHADRQAASRDEMQQVLAGLLRQANPWQAVMGAVDRRVLGRIDAWLESGVELEADAEAEIRLAMARAYAGWGKCADSLRHRERVAALVEPNSRMALQAGVVELTCLLEEGQDERANELSQELLGALPTTLSPAERAMFLQLRARVEMKREEYDEADHSLDLAHDLLGGEPSTDDLARTVLDESRGVLAWSRGDLARAEGILRTVLADFRSKLRAPHARIAASEANLAEVLRARGRWDEAVQLAEHADETLRDIFGLEHPRRAHTATILGLIALERGELDEASSQLQRAAALLEAAHPRGDSDLLSVLVGLASCAARAGEPAQAMTLYLEARRRCRLWFPEHPFLGLRITRPRVQLLVDQHDYERAAAEAAEELGAGPSEHPRAQLEATELRMVWGRALWELGRVEEARALFEQVLPVRIRCFGEDSTLVQETRYLLAMVAFKQRRSDDGFELLGEACEALRLSPHFELGPFGRVATLLAESLAVRGRFDEARDLLAEVEDELEDVPDPEVQALVRSSRAAVERLRLRRLGQ